MALHRRWVTTLGRQTIGRRIRKIVLGQAAPGLEAEDISFDLDDIVLKLIGWVLKLIFIVLVLPVVLVVVLLWAIVESIGRVVLRRPWSVDAFGRDSTIFRWKPGGYGAAGRFVGEVEQALAAGTAPDGISLREAPDLASPFG